MKTRSFTKLSQVLALSGLLFVGGGIEQSAGNAQALLNATNAEPVVSTNQPAAVATASDTNVTAQTETSAADMPVPRAEPILPPTIVPATPLAEVIKLAQSGVEADVLLSFITNSTRPFELDAEEIVYLNDLGVSGSVITAMMQHDQSLRALPSNPGTPAEPEPGPEPVATAPTYVNAPSAAPAAEAQPPYVSNNYFSDSLAPYGNWIEVEGYGRCWQPTVVVANRNWQPYCDRGRWVYTDAGWYWLSDYSWGATTFHYGRWFSHPTWGWCWWPDTVWAPSWVSWRYSGAYCGWAPLPPAACYQPGFGFSYYGSSVGFGFSFGLGVSAYTFVPWGGFCSARPYQYRVSVHQATQVYKNSTVINNFVGGNNNTVINKGIAPDHVSKYTHTEVRMVNLRDQVVGGSRNERLERDGRTLAVHRPNLSAPNVRKDTRPSRETQPRDVGSSPGPGRASSPVGVRPPGGSVSPASVPAAAPKVYQPRLVQGASQNTSQPSSSAPPGSLIVIGGKNASRSGGRDYSVWSTPSPAPASSAPVSSPRLGVPSQAGSSSIVSSPAVVETAPAAVSQGRTDREVVSRGSYPTFSTPSPRAPSVTPRSAPVDSAPNVTPQSGSENRPPNGQRIESRPTAPGPTTAPARAQSRPDSSPGPRSR